MRRFPHGGEVLGASPANPLLAPVLRPELVLSRQQALLDQRAIQRIPGLAGYWPADPAYLFEDSAGTIPASVSGVVGCWRRLGPAPVYTPVMVANPGFAADSDWTKGTGWTIADGVATKTAGTASVLSQAVSLTPGATYVLTWTMTRSAGTLTPRFTGGTTVTGTGMVLSGTYEENFVALTGNTTLEFSADASFAGTVDNVTLVSVSNAPALQATTAVKPYLRRTPTSNVHWLDSNTTTSALTATLGNLGAACTVAISSAEGVTFTEGVTISSTYNIAPAFGFNGDVAIFDRALTVTEKALLTRYMQRSVPVLGAERLVNSDFTSDLSGWTYANADATHTITWEAGTARCQFSSGTPATLLTQNGVITIGRLYLISLTVSAAPSGSVQVSGLGTLGVSHNTATAGVTQQTRYASASNVSMYRNVTPADVSIDAVSVKEIL